MRLVALVLLTPLSLLGCDGGDKKHAAPDDYVLGVPQCLRAYGAVAFNTPGERKRAELIVRRGELAVPTPPSPPSRVFAWQRREDGSLHRVYLVVRGVDAKPLSDRDARRRAIERIHNYHSRTDDFTAGSTLGDSETSSLDRHCFRGHRKTVRSSNSDGAGA